MFPPTASIWLYCVGLASFALAITAYRYRLVACNSRSERQACNWLVGALVALAISEWLQLLIAYIGANRLTAIPLVLLAVATAGFLEAGVAILQSKKLTQWRWLYAVLLIGSAAAFTGRTVDSGYLVRCCLGVAVTVTAFVAYRSFRVVGAAVSQPLSFGDAALVIGMAAAASAFLLANLFQLQAMRGIALTIVTIFAMVAEYRRQPSAHALPNRRRLALPTAFAVLLVAGWAIAACAPAIERPNRTVVEVLVELEEEAESEPASKSPKWLNAATLAITPPAVLVAIVWLLSRLQPATKRPTARA